MDWVLPTDEILAVVETAASEGRNVVTSSTADQSVEHGLTLQLPKFSVHFKRAS
jgi:hypothetical protein